MLQRGRTPKGHDGPCVTMVRDLLPIVPAPDLVAPVAKAAIAREAEVATLPPFAVGNSVIIRKKRDRREIAIYCFCVKQISLDIERETETTQTQIKDSRSGHTGEVVKVMKKKIKVQFATGVANDAYIACKYQCTFAYTYSYTNQLSDAHA